MSIIDGCLEKSNRTNVYSLRPDVVWCYTLDDSHPEIKARYGSCEDYFVPSTTYPGIHWLCRTVVSNAEGVTCRAECAWTSRSRIRI